MKREIISSYIFGDINIIFERDEENGVGLCILPQKYSEKISIKKEYKVEPLVQIKLIGDDYPFGFSQGRTMRNSETTRRIKFEDQKRICIDDNISKIITTLKDDRGYFYEHVIEINRLSRTLEFYVKFYNNSNKSVTLEMISSFTLGALSPFEDENQEGQLILHRMLSTWSAEGRVESTPIERLQLEPSWQKFSSNSIRFGQIGSMPVRGYVPFVAVEDIKNNVTWAAQLTHGSSWQLEAYRRDEALVLSGGIADREFGNWTKIVRPGEAFITPKALLTVVEGNIDIAAQRLTDHTKLKLDLPESEKGKMPLIFNEFCTTWGEPREEKIVKMANILKGKGIEYFVIDDGWYIEDDYAKNAVNWNCVGDWNVSVSRYPKGFEHTIKTIKECGMKPGIWYEFEIAARGSRLFEKSEWLLKRDGKDIVSGHRKFLDMRKQEVQEYLSEKVIGLLKKYEIEYLKVDYNENLGIGCDGEDSLGEELRQQIIATQDFFRRIHKELPQLVIEVCSSGGHRLLPSFLECSSMASFSDAHECDEIPIIAANMHRMIPVRQSQIWAVLQKNHSLQKLYYRMTGTMLGRLCISGDIEGLAKEQWIVVKEGMEFYNKVSHIIDNGITSYKGPYVESYRKPKGWQAVFRENESNELLIVFHNFENIDKTVEIEIPCNFKIIDEYHRDDILLNITENKLIIKNLKDFDGVAIYLKK